MKTKQVGTTILHQIPLAPNYYADCKFSRVFNFTKLGTFEVYCDSYYIDNDGSLTPVTVDLGMLHDDDSTRYVISTDYNQETEDYGYDLGINRAVSWGEIINAIGLCSKC